MLGSLAAAVMVDRELRVNAWNGAVHELRAREVQVRTPIRAVLAGEDAPALTVDGVNRRGKPVPSGCASRRSPTTAPVSRARS